jgi:hypothetical protein
VRWIALSTCFFRHWRERETERNEEHSKEKREKDGFWQDGARSSRCSSPASSSSQASLFRCLQKLGGATPEEQELFALGWMLRGTKYFGYAEKALSNCFEDPTRKCLEIALEECRIKL